MRLNDSSKKVVVGLSGGVDSSVSLVLLKKAGYKPIGVSLKYDVWRDKCGNCRENVCCSNKSFAIAKSICKKYGVSYHIIDVSKEFKKEVIDYFTNELKNNRTPSPCVMCNPKVKFKTLIEFADKIGAKFVATGHYARVRARSIVVPTAPALSSRAQRSGVEGSLYELLTAQDKSKDQTYSLSFLTQKELSRVIFPLGELTKTKTYKIAKKEGLNIFEKTKQSQDFCFVSGTDLEKFLVQEVGIKKGKIADLTGKILGSHNGLHFYTIGQRQGLKLPNGPYFVVRKDLAKNVLYVSKKENDLERNSIVLSPFNFISGKTYEGKVVAKVRSTAPLTKAMIKIHDKDSLTIEFFRPQRAITPGQIAVFYNGEVCLGAGKISD